MKKNRKSFSFDAPVIIRCKDCKSRTFVDMGEKVGLVGGCDIFGAAFPEDFYCAFGSKRCPPPKR